MRSAFYGAANYASRQIVRRGNQRGGILHSAFVFPQQGQVLWRQILRLLWSGVMGGYLLYTAPLVQQRDPSHVSAFRASGQTRKANCPNKVLAAARPGTCVPSLRRQDRVAGVLKVALFGMAELVTPTHFR